MPIVLIIREGETIRKAKLTSRPLLLGRSSKCAVQIADGMCSGQHCAFIVNQQSRVLVKDLDSTNGTFLNDCKIMDSHLMIDDVIKIGECEIYIDPSELSPKEKKVLTRDEPTSQIKFVNLTPEKKKGIKPSEVVKARKEQEQQRQDASHKEELERPKQLNREEALKQRIANKVKNRSTVSNTQVGLESERQIDLEESTGSTKMIKIDRPKKSKKSLGSKIKGIFKK
ncbi:FHA domain-containing protein [Halobacteriovorax sp. HLS]|uniref:FHA domain-containing protein n=1 Tax=Halobacteriovorax sp. HLS TaxID=2234000 RepID=UPI000FD9D42E|nr:FHA domain-containing protein [Halobacteriovorax sp. HLS]